jgi:hypothetical protein
MAIMPMTVSSPAASLIERQIERANGERPASEASALRQAYLVCVHEISNTSPGRSNKAAPTCPVGASAQRRHRSFQMALGVEDVHHLTPNRRNSRRRTGGFASRHRCRRPAGTGRTESALVKPDWIEIRQFRA